MQIDVSMDQFPQSAKYDANWLFECSMGPCAIWLTEFLTKEMMLKPGMRVLDMGCGKGMSSVFLAKEYDVTVFANDLWIPATDNFERFKEAGVADRVFPIHAEAHALPYAKGFFDAIISVDAYHYFGTDDLFLLDFIQYLKRGGQIGIIVPGLTHEIGNDVPENIRDYWDEGFCSLHSPVWWKEHFEKCRSARVDIADSILNGWEIWLKWETLMIKHGYGNTDRYVKLLEIDSGRTLTFNRIISTRV